MCVCVLCVVCVCVLLVCNVCLYSTYVHTIYIYMCINPYVCIHVSFVVKGLFVHARVVEYKFIYCLLAYVRTYVCTLSHGLVTDIVQCNVHTLMYVYIYLCTYLCVLYVYMYVWSCTL